MNAIYRVLLLFLIPFAVYAQGSCVDKTIKSIKETTKSFKEIAKKQAKQAIFGKDFDKLLTEAREITAKGDDPDLFWENALEVMNIKVDIDQGPTKEIPKTGSLITVANHPYGGVDGIIMIKTVLEQRKDVKILINKMLYDALPEFKRIGIPLDIMSGDKSGYKAALTEATDHVKNGGALLAFPSGVVSHAESFTKLLNRRGMLQREVTEREWKNGVQMILAKAKAPVLPMFFHGGNSMKFQVASLLNDYANPQWARSFFKSKWMPKPLKYIYDKYSLVTSLPRLLLIPREVTNKQNSTVKLSYRRIVNRLTLDKIRSVQKLARKEGKTAPSITETLKNKTYNTRPNQKLQRPIIKAATREALAKSFNDALDAGKIKSLTTIVGKEELGTYIVTGDQIPEILLKELGRSREITFREVGEGSGKAFDVDTHDRGKHCYHLILWNKEKSEIIGGYRMWDSGKIVDESGKDAIFSAEFYDLDPKFYKEINKSALELGRSFVMKEHQGSKALVYIFGGIIEFIMKKPKFKNLYGSVSISGEFTDESKSLMIETLKTFMSAGDEAGKLAKALYPFTIKDTTDHTEYFSRLLKDSATALKIELEGFESDEIIKQKILEILKAESKNSGKIFKVLNSIVAEIEEGAFREAPPLLGIYGGFGGKYLNQSFGIDLDFNTVDSLINLEVANIPDMQLNMFLRSHTADKAEIREKIKKLREVQAAMRQTEEAEQAKRAAEGSTNDTDW